MNESSFEKQLLEHAPRIHGFIRRRVRSEFDADDLAQEILLKAFRSRNSLQDQERLAAWLFRIARRTMIDHYRRQRPTRKFEDAAPDSNPSEVDVISAAVARAALCYLGTLPEEYRVAVKMADYDGLPHEEIADRLGITVAAAKSRVRRGKQRIRALMEECCVLIYDARGKVVDYERRHPCEGATCG